VNQPFTDMGIKIYSDKDVLTASRERISFVFDNFEKIYLAFSGGKDSSVMFHLVMDEAIKRKKKVAVMYIDFEAQYADTIKHAAEMFELYKDHIEPHWICIPMLLRNAVTNFQPRWVCWDEEKRDAWIRQLPKNHKRVEDYPFALPKMEFEEFVVLFGEWYSEGKLTAGFIGIRAQESLHRYCAIATWQKKESSFQELKWTTEIAKNTYNIYPIYDWLTDDIWKYHSVFKDRPHNPIYDKMQMAGVPLKHQRLCQPFGDDQKKGLWLYHILEPETWFKLIARVNGANSGVLYCEESGNMNGNRNVTLPEGHTWKSFCNMLLMSLPTQMRKHYEYRFKKFISGWNDRGYKTIPETAPRELEAKCWAPSWRRMCRCILRNDYWCKGLGQVQPKSDAYIRYKQIKHAKKNAQNATA